MESVPYHELTERCSVLLKAELSRLILNILLFYGPPFDVSTRQVSTSSDLQVFVPVYDKISPNKIRPRPSLLQTMVSASSDAREPGAIDKVHVGGVTHESLKLLVDFMYKGQIEITEENAADILVAADLLLMERLKDAICKFMQTIICAANCVFISKLADIYSCR